MALVELKATVDTYNLFIDTFGVRPTDLLNHAIDNAAEKCGSPTPSAPVPLPDTQAQ